MFISKPDSAFDTNRSSSCSNHDNMQDIFVVEYDANVYEMDLECGIDYNVCLNLPKRVNFE